MEDRETRIAEGTGMILAGHSERHAAAKVGIPRSTLKYRVDWLKKGGPEREKRLREAEEELLNLTFSTALYAQAELQRRVSDPDIAKSIPNKELVPIVGMTQDKLNMRRGWSKGQGQNSGEGMSAFAQLLQSMPQGGSVTISSEPNPEPIIISPEDVTDVD